MRDCYRSQRQPFLNALIIDIISRTSSQKQFVAREGTIMERLRYLDFELKIERKGEQYTA